MATTKRPRKKAFGKAHPNWRPRGGDGCFQKQRPSGPPLPVSEATLDAGVSTDAQMRRDARRPFVELGATGLRHFSGIIDEEFLPALRGQRAVQVYSEMRENDPTVGAVLFAVEMLMRNVDWRVEPGGDQPADLELAEFVDSCRDDMTDTWSDTLASILSFLPYGFSIHEEVYKKREGLHPDDPTRDSRYDDGRIGWRKLPVRAQDTVLRWIFDREKGDELRGVVQLPPPTFSIRTIPEEKFLLFRTTSAKANPQGRSILRSAYRPWYFKRRIEEIEGIGIERDLAGLPKMEVPAELLDVNAPPELVALRDSIQQMLRDVRRDEREGVMIPREFDKDGNARYAFDLVRSGGRRQFDTTAIVNRYDRLIASTVLADFILLGQQRVGSFALAETKTELFGFALGAWLDSIAQVFNRKAIPRLLIRNGIRTDQPPRLVHGDIETVDLKELGQYIKQLADSGMAIFPDEGVENFLRLQAGLPEKEPETEEEKREREARDQLEALQELAAAEAARQRAAAAPAAAEGPEGVPSPVPAEAPEEQR